MAVRLVVFRIQWSPWAPYLGVWAKCLLVGNSQKRFSTAAQLGIAFWAIYASSKMKMQTFCSRNWNPFNIAVYTNEKDEFRLRFAYAFIHLRSRTYVYCQKCNHSLVSVCPWYLTYCSSNGPIIRIHFDTLWIVPPTSLPTAPALAILPLSLIILHWLLNGRFERSIDLSLQLLQFATSLQDIS